MSIQGNLSKLIQVETINETAADEAKFEAFENLLREIYPDVFSACEEIKIAQALLLKWPGKKKEKPATVLMAHMDVVPAMGNWKYPPFEGKIADGCIWGRGALDDKGSLCGIFEAVQGLIKQGFTPESDVYLSCSHNEETMGPGAKYAADYFEAQKTAIGLVLDEGGAVLEKPLPGAKGSFCMLGVMEKGYANVRFTAKSKGGHASAPPKNSPITRLSAFVNHMEKNSPFTAKYSSVVKSTFKTLAPHMAQPYKLIFGNLWLFGGLLKAVMPAVSAQGAAMLKTTCAFTMMQGSDAPNVLPETASITANLRFSSHQPMAESLDLTKKAAALFGLDMQVLYAHDCSPETQTDSAGYHYIDGLCKKVFPDAPAAPYLMVGGTDSRFMTRVCTDVVRFAPFEANAQQLGAVHGLDENISIKAMEKAVAFYQEVIKGR
jgi:Acetylornithine deacetylase/Succinyl-diaminopimelate desuccinylase and related deacylases